MVNGINSVKGVFMKEKKVALMGAWETNNLGDVIQALSVLEITKRFDCYLEREKILEQTELCFSVMNGWWKHRTLDFPPSESITPLWIGVHIADESLVKKHISYWKKHQPIGCRDKYTQNLFMANGIDSYFSGCPSMCFPRERFGSYRSENNLFIEGGKTDLVCSHLDTYSSFVGTPEQKLRVCLNNMFLYSKARCVVTSRLHVALPCYAIGTPVLYLKKRDNKRFTGYEEFINNCFPTDSERIKEFVSCPVNRYPEEYLSLKQNLVSKIKEFTK